MSRNNNYRSENYKTQQKSSGPGLGTLLVGGALVGALTYGLYKHFTSEKTIKTELQKRNIIMMRF